ncbi:hypothetical protein MSPP1_000015 [Malassezia sp. CBS 17886]|nr:hypothetical protein MSPP1_000015 [Malassezia sp. CBS 17886]
MSISDLYHIKRAIREDKQIGYRPENSARDNLAVEDVTVDDAERRRTMDLLRRLEAMDEGKDEEGEEGEEGGWGPGGGDEVGESRDGGRGGVGGNDDLSVLDDANASPLHPNFDECSPEELLSMLSVRDREQFEHLLKNPALAAQMYFEKEPSSEAALAAGGENAGGALWWTGGAAGRPWVCMADDDAERNGDAAPGARTHAAPGAAQNGSNSTTTGRVGNTHADTSAGTDPAPATSTPPRAWTTFFEQVHRIATAPTRPTADLRFNTLAILLAYTFILVHLDTRSFAALRTLPPAAVRPCDEDDDGEPPPLEPDTADDWGTPRRPADDAGEASAAEAALSLAMRLLPFLFARPGADARSTALSRLQLHSAQDAGIWFLQELAAEHIGPQPSLVLLTLLRRVQQLLAPRMVHAVGAGAGDAEWGSSAPVVWALADLHALVADASAAADRERTCRKIAFYAGCYAGLSADARDALCGAVAHEVSRLEKEEDDRVAFEQVHAANRTLAQMEPAPRATPSLAGNSDGKIQVLDT